jgi:hypothetical protein
MEERLIPTYLYCCNYNTDRLDRVMKCLITSSRIGVVGVNCLEEVYSSLVVEGLE